LVGNKFDLNEIRTIDHDEVNEYARTYNLIHVEASAKTGYNVEEIFNIIGKKIIAQPEKVENNTNLEIETTYSYANNCC